MKTRQTAFQVFGAMTFSMVCGMALAQDVAGPIRVVQGFAPGGGHDTVARLLAPRVAAQLKLQSIVEARPGANGIIAAEHVARSAPDGNTVLLTGVSTFVLNQLVYAKVPYDTRKDFAPLTTVAATPQILVAHPGLPVRTLEDVAALARRSPKKLSIGSPGIGGLSHLTLEVFKSLGRLEIEHVPYKGTASALSELLSGFIPLFIGDVPAPLPHIKAGKLRAIVVTGETRSSLLPDVPTAREQGYPGLQATNWYGVMVPAATPPAVVAKLHAAFVSAVGAPETRERYAGVGVDPLTSKSPSAFGAFVQEEFSRWGKIVQSTGIRLQQ
jgi:tripartite-type tricarboxylate transporter receptor subunit TctC